jgi:hypothetical protein
MTNSSHGIFRGEWIYHLLNNVSTFTGLFEMLLELWLPGVTSWRGGFRVLPRLPIVLAVLGQLPIISTPDSI